MKYKLTNYNIQLGGVNFLKRSFPNVASYCYLNSLIILFYYMTDYKNSLLKHKTDNKRIQNLQILLQLLDKINTDDTLFNEIKNQSDYIHEARMEELINYYSNYIGYKFFEISNIVADKNYNNFHEMDSLPDLIQALGEILPKFKDDINFQFIYFTEPDNSNRYLLFFNQPFQQKISEILEENTKNINGKIYQLRAGILLYDSHYINIVKIGNDYRFYSNDVAIIKGAPAVKINNYEKYPTYEELMNKNASEYILLYERETLPTKKEIIFQFKPTKSTPKTSITPSTKQPASIISSVTDTSMSKIGITNIGNNCFFNAILQAVFHMKYLKDIMLKPIFVEQYKEDSHLKSFLNIFTLFNELQNDNNPFPMNDAKELLLNFIIKNRSDYYIGKQESSGDILFDLIDDLQLDCFKKFLNIDYNKVCDKTIPGSTAKIANKKLPDNDIRNQIIKIGGILPIYINNIDMIYNEYIMPQTRRKFNIANTHYLLLEITHFTSENIKDLVPSIQEINDLNMFGVNFKLIGGILHSGTSANSGHYIYAHKNSDKNYTIYNDSAILNTNTKNKLEEIDNDEIIDNIFDLDIFSDIKEYKDSYMILNRPDVAENTKNDMLLTIPEHIKSRFTLVTDMLKTDVSTYFSYDKILQDFKPVILIFEKDEKLILPKLKPINEYLIDVNPPVVNPLVVKSPVVNPLVVKSPVVNPLVVKSPVVNQPVIPPKISPIIDIKPKNTIIDIICDILSKN
jgi:ubiquitin C-terminal hydrolase